MSEDAFPGLESPIFANLPGKPRKEKDAVKSVTFGACPTCSNNKVGLVRQGIHMAWRDHNYRTHGGLSMQCRSVGQNLCDCPGRDVSHLIGDKPPTCPCSR